MIIAVASGKGGTGKTTVAVSLALSMGRLGGPNSPLLLDCDVEEPNAALFLQPTICETREVTQPVPKVSHEACNYCGRCAEVCQYHAIAVVGDQVLVFPELCHGCGSCTLSCPATAISESPNVIGAIERGDVERSDSDEPGELEFAHGKLNVGEPMAVPIIRQLKQWVVPASPGERPIILDSSPGTGCPVVESIRGADYVLLVTEPSPFGLHDLRLAVELARDEMDLAVGVVINRDGGEYSGVDDYLSSESIPTLMRIPLDRGIAETTSDGEPLVDAHPEYRDQFRQLYASIERSRDEQMRARTS